MTLKLHDLRPARGSKIARTRVGRGDGSKGKTAGRGTKGTRARKQVPVTFEGGQMPIHMRLPKLKGFRNRFRTEYEIVNVGDINRLFPQGGAVGVDDLVAKGAVRKNALVKVLGDGKLTAKVDVSAHKFSGSARAKITAAAVQPPSSSFGRADAKCPRNAHFRGLLRLLAGPWRPVGTLGEYGCLSAFHSRCRGPTRPGRPG